MMNRLSRVAKAKTKKLIKKMECTEDVIREAQLELKQKAIQVQTQAEKLKKMQVSISNIEVGEKYKTVILQLEIQAQAYKRKYEEYGEKSQVLLARKVLAETQLALGVNGTLDGSPIQLLEELEAEVQAMEAEVVAYTKVCGDT